MTSSSSGNLDYFSNLDSNSDPETWKEPANQPTFILPFMFQLKPSEEGAVGQDDNNSLWTNATGVTDPTQNIAVDIAKAQYINYKYDGTVLSSLTKTTIALPQNPLQSSSTLSCRACKLQILGLA